MEGGRGGTGKYLHQKLRKILLGLLIVLRTVEERPLLLPTKQRHVPAATAGSGSRTASAVWSSRITPRPGAALPVSISTLFSHPVGTSPIVWSSPASHFCRCGGPRKKKRCMPSSAAVDPSLLKNVPCGCFVCVSATGSPSCSWKCQTLLVIDCAAGSTCLTAGEELAWGEAFLPLASRCLFSSPYVDEHELSPIFYLYKVFWGRQPTGSPCF